MSFNDDIRKFNGIYGLGAPDVPSVPFSDRNQLVERLRRFHQIITDEVNEVLDIVNDLEAGAYADREDALMVELADWFADVQVYAASEATKFGLDNEAILGCVMESNFTKLGEDGKPIIKDGKVQKGPGYVPPTALLAKYLKDASTPRKTHATSGPNARQVGGTHYRTGDNPQHWDLAVMFGWDPFQYQITKYVMRWKKKHPTPEKKLEDLHKALHFLEKYISEYLHFLPPTDCRPIKDDQESNQFWQNEGYYGDGTCLYKCRKCRRDVRLSSTPTTACECSTT